MAVYRGSIRRAALAAAGAVATTPLIVTRSNPVHAAAAMLGPARPTFYRCRLGAFEVTTLLDGTDRVPVTGYHMPFPALGFIDKAGEEHRWVAASYQLNL